MSEDRLKKREELMNKITRRKLFPLGVSKTVGKKELTNETQTSRQMRIKAEFARLDKLRDDRKWDKHTETVERRMAGSPVKVTKPFKLAKYDTINQTFKDSMDNALN